MQPAPETRRKVENEVTVDAIAAFKARADVVAEAMGKKKYRIKQMNIHTNSRGPQPLYRAANKSMLMEAARRAGRGAANRRSTPRSPARSSLNKR